MLPADQGFEPGDLPGFEVNNRLGVNAQLAVVQRGAEFCFQLKAADSVGVHGGVKKFGAVAAQGLGAAHGGFRVVEQVVGALERRIAEGDADADRCGTRGMSFHVKGNGHGGLETVGDAHGVAGIGNAFQQDRKLVTAETGQQQIARRASAGGAGDGIKVAKRCPEALGDLDKSLIGESGDPGRRCRS
jgi:hypothetical protein